MGFTLPDKDKATVGENEWEKAGYTIMRRKKTRLFNVNQRNERSLFTTDKQQKLMSALHTFDTYEVACVCVCVD